MSLCYRLKFREKMAPSVPGTSLVPGSFGDFSRLAPRLLVGVFSPRVEHGLLFPAAGSRACPDLGRLRKFTQRRVIILHKGSGSTRVSPGGRLFRRGGLACAFLHSEAKWIFH